MAKKLGSTKSTDSVLVTSANLASEVTGVLPVVNGGTGNSVYTNGQLLIGNTTGNTLTKATLTPGTGISVTNGAGAITVATTAAQTHVTSVGTLSSLTVSGDLTVDTNLSFYGRHIALQLSNPWLNQVKTVSSISSFYTWIKH